MKKTTFPAIPAPAPFTQNERQILAKSYDLFAKRGIVGLAHSLLSPDEYEEWVGHALSLQLAIYGLDLYYEGRATLQPSEEGPLWERVERELQRERRRNDELLWASFADLQLYAGVETRIHQFDLIDPREFANIVRLKCADVRMARGLIWTFRGPADSRVLRYWGIYDQCWELIEDVLDIKEDGTDWNFNFWLYSFMAGKDTFAGVSAACHTLWRKVAELEEIYRCLPSELSRPLAGSYHSTALAATLARQSWRRVSAAISQGKVLRFGEQTEAVARIA